MRKPLWIVVGLVVLAGGGIGIQQWRKHAAAAAAPRYETVAVDRGPIVAKVTATGTLSALVTVQVGTQVSGRIKTINVDFNSPVKKGQVIARIEPALFEAALESARANYLAAQGTVAKLEAQAENAKVQYDRSVALFERKAIAQADLDTANATMKAANGDVTASRGNMEQAKAALHQAQVNLDYTTIISPTTGVVISRSVDVGQTVAASLSAPTLFLIAEDLTKMQVDTSVAEADIGKLKANMDATFTVDAYPSRTFKGTIRQIRNAPQTQQNVVTYDAVIDVSNPDLALRPGMTANVTFIYDHRDSALRVANAALRFQPPPEMARAAFGGGAGGGTHAGGGQRPAGGGGQRPGGGPGEGGGQRGMGGGRRGGGAGGETPDKRMLWVLRGPTPTPVRVRAGVSDGTNTEIETSELHEGDRVVTDAEFSGGDKSGQPAGAGAFRRMF
jgi:HlyD family secretion protein